jgi:RNA polymerase subunit RPABC4/transcription elongation factor Spt4
MQAANDLMTLIHCPKCEHTVSSVASRCPNCGTLLTQYRFVQGQGGVLTECRRCSRKVLSGANVCPYCGVRRPGRRTPYVVGVLVVALAAPIILFALLYSRAPQPALLGLEPPAAPARAARSARPRPTTRDSSATAARATAVVSAPAAASTAPREAAPAPVPGGRVAGQPDSLRAAALPGAVTKWALDWANVREGRSLEAAVVHVLRPGEQVLVGDRQDGWWAVYQESRVLGYVAGSLLGDQPPTPAAPDSARGVGG